MTTVAEVDRVITRLGLAENKDQFETFLAVIDSDDHRHQPAWAMSLAILGVLLLRSGVRSVVATKVVKALYARPFMESTPSGAPFATVSIFDGRFVVVPHVNGLRALNATTGAEIDAAFATSGAALTTTLYHLNHILAAVRQAAQE